MRRVPSFCNRPGFPAGLQVRSAQACAGAGRALGCPVQPGPQKCPARPDPPPQVLLLPCTSLPATDVAASVQLLREAAYEVVVSEDWKKGMALVTRGSPSGHSFDVVLAEVRAVECEPR